MIWPLDEVYHRARDIMFSDKTAHNIKMSKAITRYLRFIEGLYDIVESKVDTGKIDEQKLDDIHRKYRKMLSARLRNKENSLRHKGGAVPVSLREHRLFTERDKEPDQRRRVKD